MNRNDIAIAIDSSGSVWVAQGNPADSKLSDVVDYEGGLYFSQMTHRVAVRRADGSTEITTPSRASCDDLAAVNCDIRGWSCTGTPSLIGRL
jgi:hypothetical protein